MEGMKVNKTDGTTVNTSIIYEPKGRALEYSGLAANLYRGCSHGCLYCYAPSVIKCSREEFSNPVPRPDVLKTLAKDAARLRGDTRTVLLSFTTDPYQEIERKHRLTRQAIEILNGEGLAVSILTKNGPNAEEDFDLLSKFKGNKFGCTLTLHSSYLTEEWEPTTGPSWQRCFALEAAHNSYDIETFASMEPVIDPDQTLQLIRMTHNYVDFYKVGKLNYHPRAKEIGWPKFRGEVIELLERLGKKYYIKKDLREAV
jgi:DNA repair photolyase